MVQARWGHINQDYSLLTKIQAILLDGHFVLEHGGRNRAGRFFNFNGTAGVWRRARDRRRGRLAARHADRGSRSQLPRAAARLAVRVRVRRDRAGRSAGRDERVQVAAAPLGQRLDPDLPQAAAADPARRPAARRQGGGVLPPHRQLQLPADVRALGPDVPVHGDPLQHGLVRDAAHRRAAVLRGDVLVLQLLHGLPARDPHGLARAAEVPAVPDVGRHRAVDQQHARRASRRCSTSRPSSRGRRSTASKATSDEWVGKKYRQSVAVQPLIELALGLYFTATVFYALANQIYGTVPFLVLFQVGFLYTGLLSIVQQYAGDPEASVPNCSQVARVHESQSRGSPGHPRHHLSDIDRLVDLAGVSDALAPGKTTILKDNISWHFPFPGREHDAVAARGHDSGAGAPRLHRPGLRPEQDGRHQRLQGRGSQSLRADLQAVRASRSSTTSRTAT